MEIRRKTLILTDNYVQDEEFILPYYRLQEIGDVDVATLDGKDKKGFYGVPVRANKKIHEINVKNYDLLVLPGGAKSMEKLRQSKRVLDIVKQFNKQNKIISAICHGPQLLISADILKDRFVTGYYDIEIDLKNAGASYLNKSVVVDGNLVTCPHYKYMAEWMKQTIDRVIVDRCFVEKPWGYEYCVYNNKNSVVVLHLKKGQQTSKHFHKKKNVIFFVLRGRIKVESNGLIISKGEKLNIYKLNKKTPHSFKAITDSVILEIEDSDNKYDIVRVNDKYGRVKKTYERGLNTIDDKYETIINQSS